MAQLMLRKVLLDTSGDPIRVEFLWWEELSVAETTVFGVWLKNVEDVDRNALLAVEHTPGVAPLVAYVHDFRSRTDQPTGHVDVFGAGRLVATFPRATAARYGPRFTWWAVVRQGDDDVDMYRDEDSAERDLTVREPTADPE